MFDAVRNNQKIIQIVLALIILPFAFWGVESYIRNAATDSEVATVGGTQISLGEFQKALREQQERMRPALGGRADPAMLDNPELRRAIVDTLVNQRLLALYAAKAHLTVSDQQLAGFITSVPALHDNGKFSRERYESLVASQGMSTEMFEANVRRDLAQQQALMAVADGVVAGGTPAGRWLAAQLEEREISEAVLRPDQYAAQVKVSADAVKAFYEAERRQFEVPEQVKVEYVVLSLAAMQQAEQPSAEEVRKAMEASGSTNWDNTRRRADELLAKVRGNPKAFAELAREHSQDPGSKNNGGDLGFFGRGMMVKPFEDAVFKMKVGDISGVVESDFGFHIITLTGVRQGAGGEERQASHILLAAKKPEAARNEIIAKLKQQAAAKKYAEAAENFTNTVYEQADSLTPVAEKFRLEVKKTDWLVKGGNAEGPFANAKLMAAVFSDDAVKNKRNTEAVEVAPGTLVAARVLEYKAAAMQPLEAVAGAIEKLLTSREAAKLAAKDGEEMLARLARGEAVALNWGQPRSVSRAFAPNLRPDAVQAVFRAEVGKLPAYAGVALPNGYVLFRIGQIKPFVAADAESPRAKAMKAQYARLVAEEEFSAWLASLRSRYPVEIKQAALAAKDR